MHNLLLGWHNLGSAIPALIKCPMSLPFVYGRQMTGTGKVPNTLINRRAWQLALRFLDSMDP
jgi:hypothetical protein